MSELDQNLGVMSELDQSETPVVCIVCGRIDVERQAIDLNPFRAPADLGRRPDVSPGTVDSETERHRRPCGKVQGIRTRTHTVCRNDDTTFAAHLGKPAQFV